METAPSYTKNGLPFNAPEELKNVTITFDPAASKATFSGLPNDIDVTKPFVKEKGCFIPGSQHTGLTPDNGISMIEVSTGVFETSIPLMANEPLKFSTALIGLPDTNDAMHILCGGAYESVRHSRSQFHEGNVRH